MKIAIHNSQAGFHPRWVEYCKKQKIDHKIVDCHANDIVARLQDCDALMWHFNQSNAKDIVIAKQILFALEHANFRVFPDFKTAWHFDDKVGQKYLLEAINAPMVPSFAFYDKSKALEWAAKTSYPKVFKLRGGAGSANVKLVKTKQQANKLIKQSFGKGFNQYEAWSNLQERWRKYKQGKTNLIDVSKGVVRLSYQPNFSKVKGKERGYAYFQEFIENEGFDIRIVVIGNNAVALKRLVRENDFRASGSGNLVFENDKIDKRYIQLAFDTAKKLNSQSIAIDLVHSKNDEILIVEISYGFPVKNFLDGAAGYWTDNLKWHEDEFNPQGWMVEEVMKLSSEK